MVAVHVEPARVSVRSTIESEIRQIALEHGRTLAPLTDDLRFLESGLDSLSLAILLVRLEDSLGADPFNSGGAIAFPATLGDFVRMYEAYVQSVAAKMSYASGSGFD